MLDMKMAGYPDNPYKNIIILFSNKVKVFMENFMQNQSNDRMPDMKIAGYPTNP